MLGKNFRNYQFRDILATENFLDDIPFAFRNRNLYCYPVFSFFGKSCQNTKYMAECLCHRCVLQTFSLGILTEGLICTGNVRTAKIKYCMVL